jgi:GrpB-like predicted nucleotidyltransferase (UPF0157 family)
MSQPLPQSIATSVLVPDPLHPPIEMTIEPYTPAWSSDFQRERQTLIDAYTSEYDPQRGLLDEFAKSIVHIGSTSVPNAMAKPYIDIYFNASLEKDEDTSLEWQKHQTLLRKRRDIFLERLGYRQYGNVRKSSWFEEETDGPWIGYRYWYKPSQGSLSSCKGYFLHTHAHSFYFPKFAEALACNASLLQLYNEAKCRILADHPRISFAEYTMLKTAFMMMAQSQAKSKEGLPPPPPPALFQAHGTQSNPSMYELVHFITSAAAGRIKLAQPLPFAPNDAFTLNETAYAVGGWCQTFTPLGLALILALEPRLSALWDSYNPDTSHHLQIRRSSSKDFAALPNSLLVSPSSSKRMERLARFAPVIRHLRQHGCTVASFLSWTSWQSPTIDAANSCGADFGGIVPLDFGELHAENSHREKLERLGFQIRDFFEQAACDRSHRMASVICLPELRNFGPSAATLFCGVTCIVRALESLQLQQHLAAFMKENITDDVVSALSAENLRLLGLSLGDAMRFITTVQKELSAPQPSVGPSPFPAVVARTLKSSNFKAAHEKAANIVKKQHELFAAIDGFIVAMCCHFGVPPAAADDLFQRLQGESFENPQELLSQIQVAATRIWTSTQKLQGKGVDDALNVEFCSLINRALRDDIADVMPHLVVIVRAINALCIVRRETASLKFPPNSESHRGGALPPQHHAFFTAGKKYRVPMYLATSFSEDKAYEFW